MAPNTIPTPKPQGRAKELPPGRIPVFFSPAKGWEVPGWKFWERSVRELLEVRGNKGGVCPVDIH